MRRAFLGTGSARIQLQEWWGDSEGKTKKYRWIPVDATEATRHVSSLITPQQEAEREMKKERGAEKERKRRERKDQGDADE
jgi:hypothetical protein